MIRLKLSDGVLVLDFRRDSQLLAWNHRLFFTIVTGFYLEAEEGAYVYQDQTRIPEALRDTVEYLIDEGLRFEVDEAIDRLLKHIADEQEKYEEALESGLEDQRSEQALDALPRLVRQLKPYQLRGVQHLLAVRHGADFSVPGSGKTTVIYAGFDILRRQGTVDKLLVIGPRSCFLPWEEEFESCFGFRANSARLTGPKTSRHGMYLEADRYDLFLCTYQTAANDIGELIDLCKGFRVLAVIDESHRIKKLEGGCGQRQF